MRSISRTWLAVIMVLVVIGGSSVYAFHYEKTASHNGSITITDSLGRTFTFNHTLTRIVSIDPSATATLYALGAYGDLVGGNQFDAYPPNSSLPDVGNSYGVNFEEITNLTPQAVLGYGATLPSYAEKINNTLNIPFILDNPNSIASIENFTLMLGALTGTSANASKITSWMNDSLNAINKATENISGSKELSLFYYLSNYGGTYTAGNNTFINGLFNLAHLRNIIKINGYPNIDPSIVANDSPQVILLDQYVDSSAVNVTPFDQTPAYTNGKIYTIFNDNFFDEPDFRVVYAVNWLVKTIYDVNITLPEFPISLEYPPNYGM